MSDLDKAQIEELKEAFETARAVMVHSLNGAVGSVQSKDILALIARLESLEAKLVMATEALKHYSNEEWYLDEMNNGELALFGDIAREALAKLKDGDE